MNQILKTVALSVMLVTPSLAMAQTVAPAAPPSNAQNREEMHKQWEAMTPEQREAKKEEMRKQWEKMTPEQRAAKKAEMKAHRAEREKKAEEAYKTLSPEEQKKLEGISNEIAALSPEEKKAFHFKMREQFHKEHGSMSHEGMMHGDKPEAKKPEAK